MLGADDALSSAGMNGYSDYRYSTAAKGHTNAYLLDPVLALLRAGPRAGRLLDAGCGNGSLSASYLPYAREVYAIDLSETGVAFAGSAIGQARVRVASVYDDFTQLFTGAASFDTIVSTEVIEHLYEPRAFVRRVLEALTPGGQFIVTTPYHGYAKNVAVALAGKFDAHVGPNWDGGHIKFFSRATLTELLAGEGLSDISFVGAGRVPFLWKSMVLRAVKPR